MDDDHFVANQSKSLKQSVKTLSELGVSSTVLDRLLSLGFSKMQTLTLYSEEQLMRMAQLGKEEVCKIKNAISLISTLGSLAPMLNRQTDPLRESQSENN